jgi:hypothetical protein
VHDCNVHVHDAIVSAEDEATLEPPYADLDFSTRVRGLYRVASEPPGALEEEQSC